MKRLLPGSIAGRLILVLLSVLLVTQVISTVIHYTDRADALTILGGGQVAERIAMIANLVEETPAADRERIVAAVNGPTLKVVLSEKSLAQRREEPDWHTKILKESLKLHLVDFGPDRVKVEFLNAAKRDWSHLEPPDVSITSDPRALMHSHMYHMMEELALGRHVRVSVRLADSTWLNFATPIADPTVFWSPKFLLSMAVMVIVVVIVSIWAVRRATQPLQTFARAADRLGRDVHATPLPEAGPSEVHHAVRAFNGMQDRIRRFVDDRIRMVAAISHDLRTPITRLRLRAEFVEDEEQQGKMLADLDEMEQMIATTLAFARDDADSEAEQVFDLVAVASGVCDGMRDVGSPVSLEAPPRIPVRGRPGALRRALTNLIDNAAKYGEDTKVFVEDRGDRVAVRVEDRGAGIPEAEQENVFQAFYRIERSRSRETGGAGLGLAVARNIVRAHGGDIVLSNRPGGGLRVEVLLPR